MAADAKTVVVTNANGIGEDEPKQSDPEEENSEEPEEELEKSYATGADYMIRLAEIEGGTVEPTVKKETVDGKEVVTKIIFKLTPAEDKEPDSVTLKWTDGRGKEQTKELDISDKAEDGSYTVTLTLRDTDKDERDFIAEDGSVVTVEVKFDDTLEKKLTDWAEEIWDGDDDQNRR